MPAIENKNQNQQSNDDDDSEPEDVSFSKSKQETVENLKRIQEQIALIRENQKQRRVQRQEKYIEQKKKKLDELDSSKLPDDLLDEISKVPNKSAKINDESEKQAAATKRKSKKLKVVTPVKCRFIESDVPKTAVSDFIPLKSYKNYGITVVNLANSEKKPLIASDSAKTFKASAMNRTGIHRQTSKERLSLIAKRRVITKK